MEAEMARLEREAKERERQRILAEQRDIQKKHALERIEQLKKSELGARVVQNIDEEVFLLLHYYIVFSSLKLLQLVILELLLNMSVCLCSNFKLHIEISY